MERLQNVDNLFVILNMFNIKHIYTYISFLLVAFKFTFFFEGQTENHKKGFCDKDSYTPTHPIRRPKWFGPYIHYM